MASSKTSPSKIAVWIIVGLLIVGLAGFGTGNFGGTVRTVGAVGDHEITTDEYAQALQAELRELGQRAGRNVTLAEARQLGLEQAVMNRLLTAAALDHEAARIGISVGDGTVADEVGTMSAFQGAGGFDREAYRFALENAGFTESQFEQQLREDAARGLLQGAITAGIEPPRAYTDLISGYIGETRDLTWARLDESLLPGPVADPDPATLAAWFEENGARFERPEIRRIAYAWLSPESLVDEVEIDDGAVRALYDERIDEYVRPERRIVERLVFQSEEAAREAAAGIETGTTTFTDLVADRGLDLSDIDLGDVTEADLGEAAGAVFALEGPGIAGPAPTPLGPALFRVVAVLSAQETPFEEVRAELRREAAMGAARRAVADREGPIDDLLAGGATIEELADEPGVEVGTIDYGLGEAEGLAAYPGFRQAAEEVTAADFPVLARLEDGGVFAIRLDAVVPPAIPPLEEIENEVLEAWRMDATRARLAEAAERLAEAVRNAGSFDAFDIETVSEQGIRRDSSLPDAPAGMSAAAFEMDEGELRVLAEDDVAILRLDAVTPVDPEAVDAQAVAGLIGAQAAQGIAQDAFEAFARAVQTEAQIEVNVQAIAAVQAQFP